MDRMNPQNTERVKEASSSSGTSDKLRLPSSESLLAALNTKQVFSAVLRVMKEEVKTRASEIPATMELRRQNFQRVDRLQQAIIKVEFVNNSDLWDPQQQESVKSWWKELHGSDSYKREVGQTIAEALEKVRKQNKNLYIEVSPEEAEEVELTRYATEIAKMQESFKPGGTTTLSELKAKTNTSEVYGHSEVFQRGYDMASNSETDKILLKGDVKRFLAAAYQFTDAQRQLMEAYGLSEEAGRWKVLSDTVKTASQRDDVAELAGQASVIYEEIRKKSSTLPSWPANQSSYKRGGFLSRGNDFLPDATKRLNEATQDVKKRRVETFAIAYPAAYGRGEGMVSDENDDDPTLKKHVTDFLAEARKCIEAKSALCTGDGDFEEFKRLQGLSDIVRTAIDYHSDCSNAKQRAGLASVIYDKIENEKYLLSGLVASMLHPWPTRRGWNLNDILFEATTNLELVNQRIGRAKQRRAASMQKKPIERYTDDEPSTSV